MNLFPDPFALPFSEVMVHGAVGGQVVGQHFPLTSGSLHVEDTIENLSKVYVHGMAKAFGGR